MTKSENVIEAHNLSKKYHIGATRETHQSLQQVMLNSMLMPVRRIASMRRNRLPTDADRELWALKDVSFNVKRGETFGLIGVNGSGKSTLLKIIANIVRPTEGYVQTWGRIGSLLEVGAGFHQELNGRENVYLKGTVHGMSRQEIDEKYDSIVEFADIPDFMETPIKRYSSGMRIRLGFAVAAMMRPDIFLVDEAFAVGDMAFREKCMQEIEKIRSEGHTVLVVSHSMGHITRLCERLIWLEKGETVAIGGVEELANEYLDKTVGKQEKALREKRAAEREKAADAEAKRKQEEAANKSSDAEVTHPAEPEPEPEPEQPIITQRAGFFQIERYNPDKPMKFHCVQLLDADGNPVEKIDIAQPFRIQVEYEVMQPAAGHLIVFLNQYPSKTRALAVGDTDIAPQRRAERKPGRYRAELEIPAWTLNTGNYSLMVTLGVPYVDIHDRHDDVIEFEIDDESSSRREWYSKGPRPGVIGIDLPWTYHEDEPV
jgi:ABC-type polysaccharide/polyol phosphate transport system ATPase subunit